ncbi:exodeoxyribonuclease III [Roseibium sediminicola]|uniref:Exodeoxyribonuclease III n=1 Tax=Roseibium sediminicola TaxID=2933272 RepID=A0ABT0GQL1_9HYPH|nr:exodeoxyribonuclease III [Roseibium sp. CAU 1639]MCK7611520.1 exodeoxyribonuclease III [Roseibium sp. CAU 1639]
MKIATWNINGVKARIDVVQDWLKEAEPDIACLQEIKSVDENFPRTVFEDLGYNVETHGQKGFNGVALLSKHPLEDVQRGLPGNDADEQARYIEATVSTGTGAIRVGCLYLPNGNPLGTEKFPYKLDWMDRLIAHVERRLAEETPFFLLGDYNVIPDPIDAKNPENWRDDALFQPESRQRFRALTHLGLTEAVRATTEAEETYTFWDYQAGAWQKNNGIRIDHILLSPQATDIMAGCGIDKHVRGWEKPSDHVPVWVTLAA